MRYIAQKSLERYAKFKEGQEVTGVPDNQLKVLELLGHVKREDVEVQPEALSEPEPPRRRGRPTNAEREARAAAATETRNADE